MKKQYSNTRVVKMFKQQKTTAVKQLLTTIIACIILFLPFAALAFPYVYFTTPFNVLINSAGKSIDNSNVFSTVAHLDAFNPGEDPGPYQYCMRVNTTDGTTKTIDGRPAYKLTATGTGVIPNVWFSLGIRENGTDTYATLNNTRSTMVCVPPFTNSNIPQDITLVLVISTQGNKAATPGTYQLSSIVGNLYLYGESDGTSIDRGFVEIDTSLTITSSACSVQTSRDISVAWPSLTPSDIKNNAADNKPTTITVACEDTNSHPMTVTVTGSNGSSNSDSGIVNTSAKDLGLQLTWASNDQPIPLGEPISFDPGADGKKKQDLSIAAKPVATGDGNIPAGDFATDVTVTMEYR